ncbi:hypothetical protein RHA1_ro05364 [Rhodococcus jostii RHA1]|uniref:Uncharacterized protein n=1 Tax=Rhodococcus jostii (strain RHA1) TaxID=101510 RepID=Q0S5P2_RHOJR|nr:hypothetical protein RHA1_ro05364 [Rhodococcus jostii RHA1]
MCVATAAAPRVDGDQSTPTAVVPEVRSAAETASVAAHRSRWSRARVGRCHSLIGRRCRCGGIAAVTRTRRHCARPVGAAAVGSFTVNVMTASVTVRWTRTPDGRGRRRCPQCHAEARARTACELPL